MNADFLTILWFLFKLAGAGIVCVFCLVGGWELLKWIIDGFEYMLETANRP